MSTIGKSNANRDLACIKGSVSDFSLLSIPPRIKKYLIALRSQNFFIGRENGVFQHNRPTADIRDIVKNYSLPSVFLPKWLGILRGPTGSVNTLLCGKDNWLSPDGAEEIGRN